MFSKYLTEILVFNKLRTSTEHSTLMFFNNDDGELCISYQNGGADKASTFSEGFNERRVFTRTRESRPDIGIILCISRNDIGFRSLSSLKPTVWRIYGNYKSKEITQTRLFTW